MESKNARLPVFADEPAFENACGEAFLDMFGRRDVFRGDGPGQGDLRVDAVFPPCIRELVELILHRAGRFGQRCDLLDAEPIAEKN